MCVQVVCELVLNYLKAEETTQLRRKATWEKDHQPSPKPIPNAVAHINWNSAIECRSWVRLGWWTLFHVVFLLSCVVASVFELFYDDWPVCGINSAKQGIICEERVVDVVATEVQQLPSILSGTQLHHGILGCTDSACSCEWREHLLY